MFLVGVSVGVVGLEGEAKVEPGGEVPIELSVGVAEFEGEVEGVDANTEASVVEVEFGARSSGTLPSLFTYPLNMVGVADADETTERAKTALMNFMTNNE